MLATKLTPAQAEHIRRTQRCPACRGCLFIQADPDADFTEADLTCLACGRAAARVELKRVVSPIAAAHAAFAPKRGRPPKGFEKPWDQQACKAQCGQFLSRQRQLNGASYCSDACRHNVNNALRAARA